MEPNNNSVTPLQVATAFAGSFLGAGFVSGQELLQFFAQFGAWGFAGMAVAVALFFVMGSVVMLVARRTGRTDFDKIIIRQENRPLRLFFQAVILFFLFGVVVVMVAGAGSLWQQLLGLPRLVGSIVLCVLIAGVAMSGAQGVLRVFSFVVPAMVLLAVVVSVLAVSSLPQETTSLVVQQNPLLQNWLLSALTFVSYNLLAAISIIVPIATQTRDEGQIRKGMVLGCGLLTVIFVCILLPLSRCLSLAASSDLPMLSLAQAVSPVLGMIYGVLLFAGMFGSALSCLFGVQARLQSGSRLNGRGIILVVSLLALAGSAVGFKELIGVVYPLCGYVGILAMAGILSHWYHIRRSK